MKPKSLITHFRLILNIHTLSLSTSNSFITQLPLLLDHQSKENTFRVQHLTRIYIESEYLNFLHNITSPDPVRSWTREQLGFSSNAKGSYVVC